MRRDPSDDLATVARRRLDALARARDGTSPASLIGEIPTTPIPVPGRHCRGRPDGWVDRLPGAALGRLADLQPRHLGLIGLIAALAVLAAAWVAGRDAPRPMPVATTTSASVAPQDVGTADARSDGPLADGSDPLRPDAEPTAAAVVVVDVGGKVRRPLVATLPAGSRVIDALRRAGGARPGVDLSGLNLARVLVDGEQILVGVRAPPVATGGGPDPGAAAGPGAPVNLNTASVEALEGLPGVGPVTAEKIVAWRTENGGFTSADELLEIDGIGPKTLARIAPEVTW